MPLLPTGRHLRNSPFINLPNPSQRPFLFLRRRTLLYQILISAFFQPGIIEPDVVISTVLRKLVFVLDPSFA